MARRSYNYYKLVNFKKLVLKKLKKYKITKLKKYAGKPVLKGEQINQIVKEAILKGDPFAAVRFGSNELSISVATIAIDRGELHDIPDDRATSICRNAGFFPNDKSLMYKYGKEQIEHFKVADICAVWGLKMEDYVIDEYGASELSVGVLSGLEPYYFDFPWSSALKGKKVLVIHPFSETIEKQYAKRESLFENPEVLPQFELKTLKAVQSAAYNDVPFDTWFDALNYMYDEALKIDFDVAIIGCGAYGLPLACMLKKAGKIAIHMGGATQILFGIRGSRWDNHAVISKLYNEHWVSPSKNETPERAKEVEGACYW